MNGLNHALSGVAAFGGALIIGQSRFDQTLPSPTIITLGAVVAVGAALAPDIDEGNSKASQVAGGLGSIVRIFTGAHRTRTHWPLVMIPLLTAWCWFLINHTSGGWALGATCGIAVALGWPFSTAMILPRKYEKIVVVVAIPAGAALAWWMATRGVQPDWWLYAALPVPYFAHILGDTPTPAGISWLGPFSKAKFSAHLFRSGGAIETSFVTPALTILIGWLAWSLWNLGAFSGTWRI